MKFFLISLMGTLAFSVAAYGDWYDETQGLDFVLMAGNYPADSINSTCGLFSRGFRSPEIEEVVEGFRNGIADPEVNPDFAESLLTRTSFYSRTFAIDQQEEPPLRYIYDVASRTIFSAPDQSRDFRGLLCVSTPASRRYWYDEEQRLYWQQGYARSIIGAARSDCSSHLDNRWLPSIDELESAFHNGILDDQINPEFAHHLGLFTNLISNTSVDETTYLGIDTSTGERVILSGDEKNYYLCANIFD